MVLRHIDVRQRYRLGLIHGRLEWRFGVRRRVLAISLPLRKAWLGRRGLAARFAAPVTK